jgi:formylglycine-generating enzyme required for sulfatase activity
VLRCEDRGNFFLLQEKFVSPRPGWTILTRLDGNRWRSPLTQPASVSSATGDNLPVEYVSWDELKNSDGFLARTGLCLPSEAQWEYGSRAGTPGPYAGNGNLGDMGWYGVNSGFVPHDVGGKQANQFGLHYMHGNIWEWCEDVLKSDFYADDVPGFDPVLTSGFVARVVRGGRFDDEAELCRSASRSGVNPSEVNFALGFRPVKSVAYDP